MLRALHIRWRAGAGLALLVVLAGCAGHFLAQRDPWRKDAEIACMQSGAVRETGTIVRIEPINGPGMCGADFPLKVAALGDSAMLGYAGDLRPPGSVPNVPSQRWPVPNASGFVPAPPPARDDSVYAPPPNRQTIQNEPQYSNPMRQSPRRDGAAPMPILPPPGDEDDAAPSGMRGAPPPSQRQRVQAESWRPSPSRAPVSVPLGRNAVAAVGPVEIKPPATLACPIVSALDRWITESVQPSAQRWFRQPVIEIRQISAYSCRGMNGQPGARISEHAFGNALDVAAFTLADGRKVTVKEGWRGAPEEQGFLRDVQGAACDQFNTVLAPGSNRFHYDHIHVDLMRRASGHKICNPDQIAGEVVAARVAKDRGYAWRPEAGATGSLVKGRTASLGGKPASRAKQKSKVRNILADDDDDWIEDDGPRPAD